MPLLIIVRIRRSERLTHLYITALRSQIENNKNNDNQLITPNVILRLYACAGSYHGRRARPAASHTTLEFCAKARVVGARQVTCDR